jgi:hypothetical protein
VSSGDIILNLRVTNNAELGIVSSQRAKRPWSGGVGITGT